MTNSIHQKKVQGEKIKEACWDKPAAVVLIVWALILNAQSQHEQFPLWAVAQRGSTGQYQLPTEHQASFVCVRVCVCVCY